MNPMVLADTVVQVDGGSLITGLLSAGGAIGGGILAAAKLIINVIKQLHTENRQDRTELMGIVKSQWDQLTTLAVNTDKIARNTRAVQRKVGAVITEDDNNDNYNT